MGNTIDFPSTKKTFFRFTLELNFMDGTQMEVVCTFFGNSIDNGNYMLFSNSHPDDSNDIADIPDYMVNGDTIKYIRTINIEEVEC